MSLKAKHTVSFLQRLAAIRELTNVIFIGWCKGKNLKTSGFVRFGRWRRKWAGLYGTGPEKSAVSYHITYELLQDCTYNNNPFTHLSCVWCEGAAVHEHFHCTVHLSSVIKRFLERLGGQPHNYPSSVPPLSCFSSPWFLLLPSSLLNAHTWWILLLITFVLFRIVVQSRLLVVYCMPLPLFVCKHAWLGYHKHVTHTRIHTSSGQRWDWKSSAVAKYGKSECFR